MPSCICGSSVFKSPQHREPVRKVLRDCFVRSHRPLGIYIGQDVMTANDGRRHNILGGVSLDFCRRDQELRRPIPCHYRGPTKVASSSAVPRRPRSILNVLRKSKRKVDQAFSWRRELSQSHAALGEDFGCLGVDHVALIVHDFADTDLRDLDAASQTGASVAVKYGGGSDAITTCFEKCILLGV